MGLGRFYVPVSRRKWILTLGKPPNRSLCVEKNGNVQKTRAAAPESTRTVTLSPDPGIAPTLATLAAETEAIKAGSRVRKPAPVYANGLLDELKKSWPPADAGPEPPKNASHTRPRTKSIATAPKVLRKLILVVLWFAAISCLAWGALT